MMGEVVVGIADIKTTRGQDTIATYALGSCVGVCVYDEQTGIGGMLHAMLPDSAAVAVESDKPEKYVNSGMELLYRMLCRMGANPNTLRAKLVGGAKMFEYRTTAEAVDIGTANVLQARRSLQKFGIPLVREVTGGEVGRTIHFNPADGTVLIQSTDQRKQVI